jgi:hypothetical protein
MHKKLVHQLNVKFTAEEFQRLRKVGEGTGLTLSNIVRRSTIDTLPKFEQTRIPGSPEQREAHAE